MATNIHIAGRCQKGWHETSVQGRESVRCSASDLFQPCVALFLEALLPVGESHSADMSLATSPTPIAHLLTKSRRTTGAVGRRKIENVFVAHS
jgi:hypothetical protein